MRGQGRHEGRGHGGRIDGATWGLGAAQGRVLWALRAIILETQC